MEGEILYSLTSNSPLPLSQATPNLLSVSMDLPVVDILCKWNHVTCDLCAWPLLLSIMFSRSIHIVDVESVAIRQMAQWENRWKRAKLDGLSGLFRHTGAESGPTQCLNALHLRYNHLNTENGCTYSQRLRAMKLLSHVKRS